MSHNTAKKRVFELDVLRFLAAVAVVFYHLTYRRIDGKSLFENLDAITRFGYLGVNLFFMISGFVILWTAIGRTPTQFVISRFSRLYPIFWISIAITVLGLTLLTDRSFRIESILANMTMVAGYLNQPFIDGVYWTLQVELKFYFLIFILLLFKQIGNIDYWLIAWTICSFAAYLMPAIGTLTIHPYGPYFIAGATLFRVWSDKFTVSRALLLIACVAMSIIETLDITHHYIFETTASSTTVSVIIVCGIYLLMTAIALGHVRIGERPYLFRLAMMTYPLYLLHSALGKAIFDAMSINNFAALAIVLTILFLLCNILAVHVDRPLNKISNTTLSRWMRSIKAHLPKVHG